MEFGMFKFIYNPMFGLFSDFFSIHLNGMTSGCTGVESSNTANLVGWLTLGVVALCYAVLYHFIDSPKYHRKKWVFLTGMAVAIISALIAFFSVFNDFRTQNFCALNPFGINDVIGFSLLNALWSFLLFVILTSLPFPRKLSKNLSNTTIWKP